MPPKKKSTAKAKETPEKSIRLLEKENKELTAELNALRQEHIVRFTGLFMHAYLSRGKAHVEALPLALNAASDMLQFIENKDV